MVERQDRKVVVSVEPTLNFTFGEMESRLARVHEIASEKRTQFQARLRNFQRIGIPADVGAGRGKTVHYSPGQIVQMALALELTQLGLLPERVKFVYDLNKFAISQCVAMAARELLAHGGFRAPREREMENTTLYHGGLMREGTEETDPLSMFLYFDPTALASLTDIPERYEDQASATFFYGGAGVVRENIVKWTAGPFVRRLSLINVTAMLWELVRRSPEEPRAQFIRQVEDWGEQLQVDDDVISGRFNLREWLEQMHKSAMAKLDVRTGWDDSAVTLEAALAEANLSDQEGKVWRTKCAGIIEVTVPGGENLLIDGGVDTASSSPNETIRKHANNLADLRSRQTDHVVVFCPDSDFMTAALDADEEIVDWAFERRVLLATPANLRLLLETVATVWLSEEDARHGNRQEA